MNPQQADTPFFSVIIPTYNRAAQLHTPVESVLRQTFSSWELIIIDDGSTDNTKEIIEGYTDKRIRYIFQPNQERSAARNNGIAHAAGNYICFLDSDDYYLPEHLASFSQKIKECGSPAAVFYCNTIEDVDGRLLPFTPPVAQAANNVEWVMLNTLGSPRVCAHRDVFKKELFNPAITVGEDVDLWARVLKEFPLIHNDAATVVFVTHPGRTVGSEKSYLASLQNVQRIFRNDKEKLISESTRAVALSNAYLRIAQYYAAQQRNMQSLKYALYSLLRFPNHRAKEKIYLALKVFPVTGALLHWKENRQIS